MNKHKSDVFLFVALVLSFLFVALSFILIPIETDYFVGELSLMPFIAGIVFWVSLAAALIFLVTLSIRRRKFYSKYNLKENEKHKRIGLLCFFRNKYATAIDIMMLLSFVLLAVVFGFTGGRYYDGYIAIAISVFLVFMHCIFNGKLFFYICALRKTIRNNANKIKKGKDSCK